MHGFFAVDGKLIDIGMPPGTTNSYLGAVTTSARRRWGGA